MRASENTRNLCASYYYEGTLCAKCPIKSVCVEAPDYYLGSEEETRDWVKAMDIAAETYCNGME